MRRSEIIPGKRLESILDRLFYCPSCTTWRVSRPSNRIILNNRTRKQSQSTWGSSTAINGTRPIPARYRSLHDALDEVKRKAPAYVNLSRLQLALQSLESSRPVIRLAVLGVDVPDTARKLVRLLLADALEDEGKWESHLANGAQDYSRGVIIRHGEEDNSSLPRPQNSIPILNIPSRALEKNNIEILISSVSKPNGHGTLQSRVPTPPDTFLSPYIGTPTSESGRQVTINQPAHRCLVIADGLDQLIAVAELLASTKFTSAEDRDSVMVAVNLESVTLTNPDRKTLVMDVKKAGEGLAAIRKSITGATEYEHKWIDSGMPALSSWLTLAAGAQDLEDGNLADPVRDLISSLLTTAVSNIQAAALDSSKTSTAQGLSPATLVNLEEGINEFSRSAHQELQSGLASAWQSRNWRKLAWYKLFWRVDDVGLIITDLVNSAWLPKTERAVYEWSGRLIQVGINPVTESAISLHSEAGRAFEITPVQEVQVLQPESQLASAAIEPVPTQPTIVNRSGESDISIEPIPQAIPIATTVSRTRNSFMSDSITSLTTTAQQLVFRTLSITGFSAGLSGLTYVSLFSSVYEAGTIAAVGTVFALWRMQSGWQKATKQLENGLFDEGRSTIVEVVNRMQTLVKERSKVDEDPVVNEARLQAENAVNNAVAELEKIESKGPNETSPA